MFNDHQYALEYDCTANGISYDSLRVTGLISNNFTVHIDFTPIIRSSWVKAGSLMTNSSTYIWQIVWYHKGNGKANMYPPSTANFKLTGPAISLNTKHCMDIMRSGNVLTWYIDGAKIGSFTETRAITEWRIVNASSGDERQRILINDIFVCDDGNFINTNYTPNYNYYFKEYELMDLQCMKTSQIILMD